MGLTGLITWAEVRLRPIVSRSIEYMGEQVQRDRRVRRALPVSTHIEYTVAWIDCVSTGQQLRPRHLHAGRSLPRARPLTTSKEPWLSLPIDLPAFALNRPSMAVFNTPTIQQATPARPESGKVDYEPFFYPLDSVLHWNRMYGKNGLLQFQCVLPHEGRSARA